MIAPWPIVFFTAIIGHFSSTPFTSNSACNPPEAAYDHISPCFLRFCLDGEKLLNGKLEENPEHYFILKQTEFSALREKPMLYMLFAARIWLDVSGADFRF